MTTSTPDVQLVKDLVARIPAYEDVYESHVFNQDGVLPHVFFWDVYNETMRSYLGEDPEAPDWRRTLAFLEEQSERGVREIDEVIVTSFLDYLPHPGEPGHGIVEHLGPVMRASLAEIRPSGG